MEKIERKLHITSAPTRTSKDWRTKMASWNDFLARLITPQHTAESVKQYNAMTKAERGRVKDVGGFVGGAIEGKRRKAGSVLSRSLITLDIDNVKAMTAAEVWDQVALFSRLDHYTMAMYSTHSHRPDRPRLRLIIPLKEDVPPDEYVALARKVAEMTDIPLDFFDETTYEVARLMYWPSVSQDGVYFIEHKGGDFLDGKKVLKEEYQDWRDTTEWPTSLQAGRIIERSLKKQEDPLDKKGLIGAFCRTYTIDEAIEKFLPDVYVPAKGKDRYTYKEGTSFGGAVVYEGKFLYSHHGSDPISGTLVNAFDLVRVHLFGGLDSDEDEDTRATSLPSYKKMLEMIGEDEETKKTNAREKREEALSEFDFDEGEESFDFVSSLQVNKKGDLVNTIDNIFKVLRFDPKIRGKLRYDSFANKAIVDRGVPWGKDQEEHFFQDVDDSGIRNYLQKAYGLGPMNFVEDAKNLVFDENRFHPVRAYFKSLPPWDGVKRVERLFQDYLGVEDSAYTREVARIHLVAAVKRVFEPGCKYDTMVILAGKQGIGKSTFIRELAGSDWFSDSLYILKGKEAAELIQGVWHIEIGELGALRKTDRDSVKSFLSKTDDQYRVAYAKNTSVFPRQCVFWGTTNEYNFLRDPTGDRRSYPIDCGEGPYKKDIFKDLEEERDQIWAEAYQLYREGARTYLTGEALEEAVKSQLDHKEDVPSRGIIQRYLEMDLPDNWEDLSLFDRQSYLKGDTTDPVYSDKMRPLDQVCAMQIWCELFDGRKNNLDRWRTSEFNDVLTEMPGWERASSPIRFRTYGLQRGFRRIISRNSE